MKILMVSSFYPPYHVGGACMHVYYLANALAKKGHVVHVVYSIDSYYLKRNKKPTKNYQNHKNVVLHPIKTKLGKFTPLTSYITGIIPFNKELKNVFEEEYDLIHYHNISLFGPKIFLYGKGKKIYTAHDHWLICPLNNYLSCGKPCSHKPGALACSADLIKNKRPLQFWRFTSALQKGLQEIDLIISPSKYLKEFYEGFNIQNTFEVLPNFVPSPLPTKPIKQKDFFLFMGMLEPLKGIADLLEVFKNSKKELYIAGVGSMQNEVESAAKEHPNIHYLGYIGPKEKYAYLKSAKALILPSRAEENCPLTILESFSVGTPVIGSHKGGIPELLGNSYGKTFSNQDALKRALSAKFPSKETMLQEFKKKYSEKAYVEHYLSLIKSF